MTEPDPFHEGERWVQAQTGERESALRNAPILGSTIPTRALELLAEQRMLVIGSQDAQGRVWASIVLGARGFASSPDGRSLSIARDRLDAPPGVGGAAEGTGVPARSNGPQGTAAQPGTASTGALPWRDLRVGAAVGALAIDLATRRRLRINGVVSQLDGQRLQIDVREAYTNCPKYIHRHHVFESADSAGADPVGSASGRSLGPAQRSLIEGATTLFVASRHPLRGPDVSHRGGAPGFVRVLGPDHLRMPDYPGNSMFNTFGNFVVDERAGLAVPDFTAGRLLQLTGTAELRLGESEDSLQPTGGTGRYWDFHVARWLDVPLPSRLSWEPLEPSPHNPNAPPAT